MKRASILMVMLCMALIMTACQQTPNRQVVVGKNNGVFENAMAEEWDGEQSINIPKRWEAHYDKYDGKVKMDIDAEVIISDATTYPVAEIKPYYIPIEQADKIIEGILGTKDVYLDNAEKTRAEIEEDIINIKAQKAQAEKDGDDEYVEVLESCLKSCKEELQEAPIESKPSKYNGEYIVSKSDDYEQHFIQLIKNPADASKSPLCIHNTIMNKNGHLFWTTVNYFSRMSMKEFYGYDMYREFYFEENPLFQTDDAKEAVQTANQYLEDMGIADRVLVDMMAVATDATEQEISGYQLTYCKKFNDILIPYGVQQGGSMSMVADLQAQEVYTEPYQAERLILEVEGDKIVEMLWDNVYEVGDILKDNVRLLPFEEIMANTENQMAVKYTKYDEHNKTCHVYVDQIILTYAVEPIKNERYRYMLVPVWAFYGGTDYGDGTDLGDGRIREGKYRSSGSLLTVNAVDGSIVKDQ